MEGPYQAKPKTYSPVRSDTALVVIRKSSRLLVASIGAGTMAALLRSTAIYLREFRGALAQKTFSVLMRFAASVLLWVLAGWKTGQPEISYSEISESARRTLVTSSASS